MKAVEKAKNETGTNIKHQRHYSTVSAKKKFRSAFLCQSSRQLWPVTTAPCSDKQVECCNCEYYYELKLEVGFSGWQTQQDERDDTSGEGERERKKSVALFSLGTRGAANGLTREWTNKKRCCVSTRPTPEMC